MPSDQTRQKVFANGTMIIEKASKVLDEGYYTCAAFGNQRKESNSGTVQIQVLSMYRSTSTLWYLSCVNVKFSTPSPTF